MASDSGAYGGDILSGYVKKICKTTYKGEEAVAGFSGALWSRDQFLGADNPEIKSNESEGFIVCKSQPLIAHHFNEGGSIAIDFSHIGCYAIGGGQELAIGMMRAGMSATEAIRAVSEIHTHTKGPIQEERL